MLRGISYIHVEHFEQHYIINNIFEYIYILILICVKYTDICALSMSNDI